MSDDPIVPNALTPDDVALLDAIRADDTAAALRLLDAGADANALGYDGPALHLAAGRGNHNVVRALLEKGARPHEHRYSEWWRSLDDTMQTDDEGTAIALAARSHHLDVVEVLLQHGASPDEALEGAVVYDDARIAKFVLDRGARPSSQLLAVAADSRRFPLVELLVEYGVDVNGPAHADDGSPRSAIASALYACDERIARFLVDRGATFPDRKTLASLRRRLATYRANDVAQFDALSFTLGLRKTRPRRRSAASG